MKIPSILNSASSDPSKIIQSGDGVLYREMSPDVINLVSALSPLFLYDSVKENKVILRPSSFHLGPSCWSSAQVQEYFEFIGNLFIELSKHGFTLIDGHPWNFVFEDSNIKFIDFGSFIPFTDGGLNASLREAHEFGCLIKFYKASYMKSLRMYLAKNATSKTRHSSDIILELGFKGLHENDCYINLLERFNRITNDSHQPKSTWLDYRVENESIELKSNRDPRFVVANDLIVSSGAKKVVDIGSNDGLYSIVAAAAHGISVLALEIEDANSSWLHRFSKKNGLKITSATCTLEDYVYHLKYVQKPFRPVIDLAMLFAVFHHMVHDANYTVAKLVEELEFLGVKKIILEFISYDDVFLSLKTRVAWYNLDNIIISFQDFGYHSRVFPEHEKGRRLLYLEKNSRVDNEL
jgi:hypothetical protein